VIKVKYAGMRGNMQGEKKDSNPATNAAEMDILSANNF
jgi:hypothetical protein